MKRALITCLLTLSALSPIHAQGQTAECTIGIDTSFAGVYIPLRLDTLGDNWSLSHPTLQLTWNTDEGFLGEFYAPEKPAMAFRVDADVLRDLFDDNFAGAWGSGFCVQVEADAAPTETAKEIWAMLLSEFPNIASDGNLTIAKQGELNTLFNRLYAEVIARDDLASVVQDGSFTMTSFSVLASSTAVWEIMIATAPLADFPVIIEQMGEEVPDALAMFVSDEPFARELFSTTLHNLMAVVMDTFDLEVNIAQELGEFRYFDLSLHVNDYGVVGAFPETVATTFVETMRPFYPRLLELGANYPTVDIPSFEDFESEVMGSIPEVDLDKAFQHYLPMHASFHLNVDAFEPAEFPADHFSLQRKGVLVQNLSPILQMVVQQAMMAQDDGSDELEF